VGELLRAFPVHRERLKNWPIHSRNDVEKRDIVWRTGQEVAALSPPNAAYDARPFELEKNVHEILLGHGAPFRNGLRGEGIFRIRVIAQLNGGAARVFATGRYIHKIGGFPD